MTANDADVLIVGAGPSGLALATELTMRGHAVRIIEKNDRTGIQPRAKTTNVRTMAHMRRWGLASRLRQRSPLNDDYPRRVLYQTSLLAKPIFAFDDAFCASPVRRDEFPEHAEFIPQYVVEGILADHVASHPLAQLTFGRELIGFTDDGDSVEARLRGADGAIETLRAGYIVGADGGRSTVRTQLGIEMKGQRHIQSFATLILRIPGLSADPDVPKALFHWIVRPDATCIIGPMDRGDLWYFARVATPQTETAELLSIVQRAIGHDMGIEVVARDNWVVHSLIAEQYRQGRAFLIGDACHLHSPFGGHGMNLGIGDAVDLGWKLSARLQGWGGEGLLDSYAIEREQVHRQVIVSATQNASVLSERFADARLGEEGADGDAARAAAAQEIETLKAPEFRSLGLVLGYCYENSAAVSGDEPPAAALEVTRYRPTAHPGHLAPHAWLGEGNSLYDHFGPGFTLLALVADAPDSADLVKAAAAAGLPLTMLTPDRSELRALYGADYVLVRPDQHVAWRGNHIDDVLGLVQLMTGAGNGQVPSRRHA